MSSGQNIVGISASYHNSAACILRDGILVAAAEEERFSRCKNDRTLPWQSLRYCLAEARLSLAEVDCFAYYEDPVLKVDRQRRTIQRWGVEEHKARLLAALDPDGPLDSIREQFGYRGPIEVVAHHLSHAASAFYASGYDDAALLTMDGVGEWATTSYGRASRAAGVELFDAVDFPHSVGLLYSTLTAFLGFEVNEGEYKVMGLAPHGEPRYDELVWKLVRVVDGGGFELDLQYFSFTDPESTSMFGAALEDLLQHPPRRPGDGFEPWHADLAASLQVVVEAVILDKVRYLRRCSDSHRLCLSGGVALNCVANARIRATGLFDEMFVQPAAGDAGGALGAAAVAHHRRAARPPQARMDHAYWGPAYSDREVVALLTSLGLPFEDFRESEDLLIARVVDLLAAQKVVGWFHGRMEFGPRALGARSILADPGSPTMQQRVNDLVKLREGFRPFAPVVLEERAADLFDTTHPMPFMTETTTVKVDTLPAVTHCDGSARLQTVARRTNPRLAKLLQRFGDRQGYPVLLNTSFNQRGEPIVCSPEDALGCFARSHLDALVLESAVLQRASVPPFVRMLSSFRQRPALPLGRRWGDVVEVAPRAPSTSVYTLT